MTKGEIRKARREAHKQGKPFTGELALDKGNGSLEFSETAKGEKARYHYARRYDALNGAPSGDDDR